MQTLGPLVHGPTVCPTVFLCAQCEKGVTLCDPHLETRGRLAHSPNQFVLNDLGPTVAMQQSPPLKLRMR